MQVTFLDFGKSRNHAAGRAAEGDEWLKFGIAEIRRNYVLWEIEIDSQGGACEALKSNSFWRQKIAAAQIWRR